MYTPRHRICLDKDGKPCLFNTPEAERLLAIPGRAIDQAIADELGLAEFEDSVDGGAQEIAAIIADIDTELEDKPAQVDEADRSDDEEPVEDEAVDVGSDDDPATEPKEDEHVEDAAKVSKPRASKPAARKTARS